VRNHQQQAEKYDRGQRRHRELVSPRDGSRGETRDAEVAAIGEQYADHDVELEQTDERTAPMCRRDFRKVHRSEHR
jgi:hypothetical protein